ncbi:MAG: hypothetical protein Q8L37_03050 [Candidatus Gottesmanbacteria bacterium]|nr:hypothetical protein [Candidatus Gottesmanbacteria bacterium]
MNKKIALVKLIRNSFILPNEDKLILLDRVNAMSGGDVEELGRFLAEEHDFILKNETGIRGNVGEIMETVKTWKPEASKTEKLSELDKVYVGVGKPIV